MDEERRELVEASSFYVTRLQTAIRDEAKSCQQGKVALSKNVVSILDGLKFALESVVKLTDILETNPGVLKETMDCIQNLTGALSKKDKVALVDIYEYELAELLDGWKQKYTELLNA